MKKVKKMAKICPECDTEIAYYSECEEKYLEGELMRKCPFCDGWCEQSQLIDTFEWMSPQITGTKEEVLNGVLKGMSVNDLTVLNKRIVELLTN